MKNANAGGKSALAKPKLSRTTAQTNTQPRKKAQPLRRKPEAKKAPALNAKEDVSTAGKLPAATQTAVERTRRKPTRSPR